MKLSISNIGWKAEADDFVYDAMKTLGFTGLEIAPTRIFPISPYDKCSEASLWASSLGFVIPSMQSIWNGRTEQLFGSDEERKYLLEYTKKAVDFASAIGCKNLVFGCPRNRSIPSEGNPSVAVDFFRTIGDYAALHGTVIGMEANPPIYNTNFINTTQSALDLIEDVGSPGFLLNLDVGTMVENSENVDVLDGRAHLVNHVHISEPGLKLIQKRTLHRELSDYLKSMDYDGYISIEVGTQEDAGKLVDSMEYVRDVFNAE